MNKLIHKFILLITIIISMNNSYADEWMDIGDTDEAYLAIKAPSSEKQAEQEGLWLRATFKNVKKSTDRALAYAQYYADCENRNLIRYSLITYSKNKKIIDEETYTEKFERQILIPNSVNDIVYRIMCE